MNGDFSKGAPPTMRLFYNATSPYARIARVAILEKGLQGRVELVETDPWSNPPELLEVNPLSKVPVLDIEGVGPLTESSVIAQVLDLLSPSFPLLPAAAPARIDTLTRAALAQGLIDAAFGLVLEGRRPEERRWADWTGRLTGAVTRAIARVAERRAPSGRFDLGDITLAVALSYCRFRHPGLHWPDDHPGLAAWLDRVERRPSFVSTQP